jgi:bacillithiol system protein YtxJ
MNWIKLNDMAQLDAIDVASKDYPVFILKHSITCNISATALNRLERKWNEKEAGALKPYYLDLLTYRPISNEIAARYGIQHQSPQVLVISNGKCVYNTSHLDINYDDILDEVKAMVK